MKYILLLIALASTLCFNLRSTKQNYDAYVMAVQWPNGFCSASKCNGRDSVVDRNAMTIHGLWPSLKNGNRLNECTSGKKIIDNSSSLFQSMRTNWPSLTSTKNVDFWGHEYNKHGYCMVEEYGWSGYERYFQFVIDLHNRSYKNIIKNAFSSYSYSASGLYSNFSFSFSLSSSRRCASILFPQEGQKLEPSGIFLPQYLQVIFTLQFARILHKL